MIFDETPLFGAPLPVIAYAVTEGGHLLYADPPARAALAAVSAALLWREGCPRKTRTLAFSVGERALSLSLFLLGGKAARAGGEELLSAAEEDFLSCLREMRQALGGPRDFLLLSQTLATLARQVRPGIRLRFLFDGQPSGIPLPVSVQGRTLFLALGLAARALSPFGELTLALRREAEDYCLALTSPGAVMPPFPTCLLERAGERGSFSVSLIPDGILFSMTPVMSAVALRDFEAEALLAFSHGCRALGGPATL